MDTVIIPDIINVNSRLQNGCAVTQVVSHHSLKVKAQVQSWPVHVKFVADNVILGNILLKHFHSPLSVSVHQHTHSFSSTCKSYGKDKWVTPENLQKAMLFWKSGSNEYESIFTFSGFKGVKNYRINHKIPQFYYSIQQSGKKCNTSFTLLTIRYSLAFPLLMFFVQ